MDANEAMISTEDHLLIIIHSPIMLYWEVQWISIKPNIITRSTNHKNKTTNLRTYCQLWNHLNSRRHPPNQAHIKRCTIITQLQQKTTIIFNKVSNGTKSCKLSKRNSWGRRCQWTWEASKSSYQRSNQPCQLWAKLSSSLSRVNWNFRAKKRHRRNT